MTDVAHIVIEVELEAPDEDYERIFSHVADFVHHFYDDNDPSVSARIEHS